MQVNRTLSIMQYQTEWFCLNWWHILVVSSVLSTIPEKEQYIQINNPNRIHVNISTGFIPKQRTTATFVALSMRYTTHNWMLKQSNSDFKEAFPICYLCLANWFRSGESFVLSLLFIDYTRGFYFSRNRTQPPLTELMFFHKQCQGCFITHD